MAHPYCTQADLQIAADGDEQLRQLADQDGDGAIDVAVKDRVISRADSFIDSYICNQYAVPLATVPDQIRNLSADIARLYLKRVRRCFSQDDADELEQHEKWLMAVAKGDIKLIDPALPQATTRIDEAVERSESLDVGRKKLRGFW